MNKTTGLTLGLTLVSFIGFSAGCTSTSANPPGTPTPVEVPYKKLVEDFITSDATFKFDGIPGNVTFVKTIGSTDGNTGTPVKDWEFTVGYQTGHPGHGDRSGQVLAQVITDHTAVISVEDGKIVSAECDRDWDMVSDTISEANARKIAEGFVLNDETFGFDGIPGSIKHVKTEPGWTSVFRSAVFTFDYQTGHPGHGERSVQVLAQVITNHTAVIMVNFHKGEVALAICDKTWDMVHEKNPPASVTGTVVRGGDTTMPGGPLDTPRIFTWKVQRPDGTFVNVSHTAYPPSPAGDAARAKITLDFAGGSVNPGDRMDALGRLDKEINTIEVADEGDYIKTYPPKP